MIEFETTDPELAGKMTQITLLEDAGEGAEVTIVREGIPSGIDVEANELGTRMALDNLAALVEGQR